jgi:hypothetical protein
MPVRSTDAVMPSLPPQVAPSVLTPTPPRASVRDGTTAAPQAPPKTYVRGASHAGRRSTARVVVDLVALGRVAPSTPIAPANDLTALLKRIDAIRRQPGVQIEELGRVEGAPITAIHLGAANPANPPRLRVLVTAGVHGNEACGPAAALSLMERILAHPELAAAIELTVIPVVNPTGFAAVTRDNSSGLDLNRHFGDVNEPIEARLVRRIFASQRFDLAVDLHLANDSRSGFFAIHRDCNGILKRAMAEFRKSHPVMAESAAPYTLQAPGICASGRPGTLKEAARNQGSRWTLILEAPGRLPYRDQAKGLVDLTCDIMAAAVNKVGKG